MAYNGPDRRLFESRRKCDVFPDGGAITLTYGVIAVISFGWGFFLGWWIG